MYFKANYHQRGLIKESLLFMTSNPVCRMISHRTNKKQIFLAMKITTALMFFACFTASAGGIAQKVTLSQKDVKLEKVFREIRKQTGYVFFYDARVLQGAKSVSIDVKDASVEEALKETLQGQPLDFSIEQKTVTIVQKPVISKPIVDILPAVPLNIITGTVKDEKGNPLAGVSVIIKGTKKGTSTKADGSFTIDANAGDILEFTRIGYKKKSIKVGQDKIMNVVMELNVLLGDEVIVVGYGTQKKSDLTGSVARANIGAFADQPNISIMQSLQGTVAGLNVGAVTAAGSEPSVTIRGRNTLSGATSPLIVLDGVIYHGSLIDINSIDVQSVDVLKDASAEAIYGSQAANGVLLITTKNGKQAKKPNITFSTYYATSEPSHEFHPLDRNGYIAKTYNMYWKDALLPPDYINRNPAFDPSTTWTQDQIKQGYADGTNTNWLDLVTQRAFIYNANVSISGNADGTSYFLSAGYTDQDTWVKNDKYKKINIRGNFERVVSSWLTIGMNTFISSGDYSGVAADLRNGMTFSPLVKPYNSDGTLNLYPQGNDRNPLAVLKIDDLDRRLNLFGNFFAKFQVPYIKGLSYKINYSTNYQTRRASQFDPYGFNATGSAFKDNSLEQDQSIDNLVSYEKKINNRNSINVTLLYGYEKRYGDETDASSGEFLNQTLGYNSLESGNVDKQQTSSSAWMEYSLYQMGRVNYKFDDKYLTTLTVRRDGFSGFGSNKKFGIFPSAAFAWVASKEKFIAETLPWANQLKVRLSYGSSGNRTVGRYQTLAQVSSGYQYVFGDGGAPTYGQSISSLANNDLGWETTTGLNVGLDFGILGNRISGSIDYYSTNTKNILFNVSIPVMNGFSSVNSNIGKVANRGLEITLNSINIQRKDFEWRTALNFSRNNNRIVTILGRDDNHDGKEDDLISNGLFIGKSIGTIYDYVIGGKYQIGDNIPSGYHEGLYILKDLNKDSIITAANDRQIIGHTEPAYSFSIYNEFNYKSWHLSVFLNSVQGGKNNYLGSINAKDQEFGWQYYTMATFNTVKEFNYWTPANPNGEYSSLLYGDPIDPGIYRSRSFIRLQDVNLSYDIPQSILKKYSINKLNVFLSGQNLHTWTKWKGLDPETGVGFQLGAFPVMRSYSFGINLTF